MEAKLIESLDDFHKLYRNEKTGIAFIQDFTLGTLHSCHPNIDKTGSVRGMKNAGYWEKDAQTAKSDGFIYNTSVLAIDKDDPWSALAAEKCMCPNCIERRQTQSAEKNDTKDVKMEDKKEEKFCQDLFDEYSDITARFGGTLTDSSNGSYIENGEKKFFHSLIFSKYSPEGQDFNLEFDVKPDLSDFVPSFRERLDCYDPEEETMLWVDSDGHGKNGAPYHLKDVLKDMEDCKKMSKEYINGFEKILRAHDKNVKINNTKENVGKLFIKEIIKGQESPRYCGYPMRSLAGAIERNAVSLYENGNPKELKKLLSEYLIGIGIRDEKEETFASCIGSEIEKYKEREKRIEEKKEKHKKEPCRERG